MKITLLILSLLAAFILNIGCANMTPQDQQFWLGLTKVHEQDTTTYQQTTTCTTQTLPSGHVRTVCNH